MIIILLPNVSGLCEPGCTKQAICMLYKDASRASLLCIDCFIDSHCPNDHVYKRYSLIPSLRAKISCSLLLEFSLFFCSIPLLDLNCTCMEYYLTHCVCVYDCLK